MRQTVSALNLPGEALKRDPIAVKARPSTAMLNKAGHSWVFICAFVSFSDCDNKDGPLRVINRVDNSEPPGPNPIKFVGGTRQLSAAGWPRIGLKVENPTVNLLKNIVVESVREPLRPSK